ncbi:MAG: hypothetical protein E7523_10215 [Ruminococcaceae bacterium]|nr:hypothetical protein [Oscillospiraceae bacterium]
MKKTFHKYKKVIPARFKYYFLKCHAFILFFAVAILFLPVFFAFLIKNVQLLNIFEPDSLLVFWGTTVSITTGLIGHYFRNVREQNLRYNAVPKIQIEVKNNPNNTECFVLTIYKNEDDKYNLLYVEGEFVSAVVENKRKVYLYPIDIEVDNRDWIPVFISPDDEYPKEIMIGVCDMNDLCWSITYKRVIGNTGVHYVVGSAYQI